MTTWGMTQEQIDAENGCCIASRIRHHLARLARKNMPVNTSAYHPMNPIVRSKDSQNYIKGHLEHFVDCHKALFSTMLGISKESHFMRSRHKWNVMA